MDVAVADFDKFSMKLNPTHKDINGNECSIYIVPALFCGILFWNDSSYFTGHTFPFLKA